MLVPTPRQRELLAFIGRGGSFVRLETGKPWQLVVDEPLSSWVSDAGLRTLFDAGWIDAGAAIGNMIEFAPSLTDDGRDVLGEAREAAVPQAPASEAAIDADIQRRRGVGLTNRAIAAATGRGPSRVLKTLDDRIPDAPRQQQQQPREIDPARVDHEPPAPVPAKTAPSGRVDDKWGGDELDYLTSQVERAVAEHGNKRGKPLYLPYRALSRRFARTEAAVAGKVGTIRRQLRAAVDGKPSPVRQASRSEPTP